jgi:hypothetical protein
VSEGLWVQVLRVDIFSELNPFKAPEADITPKFLSFVAMIKRCRLALNQTMRIIGTVLRSFLVQIHDRLSPDLTRALAKESLSIAQIVVLHRRFLSKVEQVTISSTSANTEITSLVSCASKALHAMDLMTERACMTLSKSASSLFTKLQVLQGDEMFVFQLTNADREFSRVRQLTSNLMSRLEILAKNAMMVRIAPIEADEGRDLLYTDDMTRKQSLVCVAEWASHLHAQLFFAFN